MCNNCNCDNYDQCSIVGYLPVGFCCSKCYLYNEQRTCLSAQSKKPKKISQTQAEKITPIETKIEAGMLKVIIEKDGKKVPLVIDLKQQLGEK